MALLDNMNSKGYKDWPGLESYCKLGPCQNLLKSIGELRATLNMVRDVQA